MSAGDGASPSPPGEIAPVLLPDPARLFPARAARLAALAADHPAGAFLELLGRIARGQAGAQGIRIPPGAVASARRPLERLRRERDPSWRAMLRVVLAAAREGPLPAPAQDAIARLERAADSALESLADAAIASSPGDLAAAPFVGAALEAQLVRLAAGLDAAALSPGGEGCPACDSPPVAAVILPGDRLRYVCCSLCGTRWHLVRISCAACGGTDGISYFEVEGAQRGVRAEACDACRGYLKVLDLEQAPDADPVADDAATLVLDLLLSERGYHRIGVNLLAPGGEPAETPAGS